MVKRRTQGRVPIGPKVSGIVSRDRLPLSVAKARRLRAPEVAQLKAIVQGRAVPAGAWSLTRAISALVQKEPSADVAGLLGHIVADRRASTPDRAAAAAALQFIPVPEARRALLDNLSVADPVVRVRVVRSLGAVGDADALAALDAVVRTRDPVFDRQVAAARTFIAHRLGVTGRDLAFQPGVERRAGRGADLIPLTLRPMLPRTVARERAALRGSDYGITTSPRLAFNLRAGKARWTVFVNNEIVSLGGFGRLADRPWITALLARWDERTKSTAVQYVVLTDPDEGGATIQIVRPDGEVFYAGRATREPRGLFRFAVSDLDRAGTAPTTVKGLITTRGVELTVTVPFGARRGKREGEAIVA